MPNPTVSALLTPFHGKGLELPNRIVMAPMTRYRASEEGVPARWVADYYAQRSSAGLIVSEGIWPSMRGQSGWRMPGLATDAQVHGWRAVTDAVHAAGGRIFAQLMHGGRAAHPLARIDGGQPLAPSAVPLPYVHHTRVGTSDPVVPRAMTYEDIRTAIEDHVNAARRAIDAGFDGVELHGANSYLIHQFLADNTNLRTDAYGGDVPGRIRFATEVVRAVMAAVGAGRTALRLSPGNEQFDMVEADPGPVYRALLDAIAPWGLAYLHLTEGSAAYPALADLRPHWPGALVANVGENGHPTTPAAGEAVLRAGTADLVSYGRAFIANPDLPRRIAAGAPLASADPTTFYTHGPQGYTDYPALATCEAMA
ncbi:alkene reductase [Streptomyces zagrosensis]|uniref:N-ethylmaleimide reductase n=1 Tax=Streptomyces zagrosensis TaxID=1042984 RepID=A0A7W9UYR3_9ACTN|nr:alkene reductase [Streptomyces zagrosensis]MBB5936225.1 N-ethylmaleimide reductase [Streptomyces zagrosensis]